MTAKEDTTTKTVRTCISLLIGQSAATSALKKIDKTLLPKFIGKARKLDDVNEDYKESSDTTHFKTFT